MTTQQKTIELTCPRCDGRGILDEFSHIASGRCFLCGGSKKISSTTKYPRKAETAKYEQGVSKFKLQKLNGMVVNKVEKFERISILWGWQGDGATIMSVIELTEANKPEMRTLWRWLQENGFKLTTSKNEIVESPCIWDESGKPI